MTTPTRDQIVSCIRENPGISTVSIVRQFEDPSDKTRFTRAYCCVWRKLADLAKRGEIVGMSKGTRRDGQSWIVQDSWRNH